MENANSEANSELLNLFFGFLDKKVPLADFQEAIALAHWDIESAVPELSSLVYTAVGKLSEFSRGHRTESSLREDLANAVRPFARRPYVGRPKLGKPSVRAITANRSWWVSALVS